jgi:hypothetical protein
MRTAGSTSVRTARSSSSVVSYERFPMKIVDEMVVSFLPVARPKLRL